MGATGPAEAEALGGTTGPFGISLMSTRETASAITAAAAVTGATHAGKRRGRRTLVFCGRHGSSSPRRGRLLPRFAEVRTPKSGPRSVVAVYANGLNRIWGQSVTVASLDQTGAE